MSVTVSFTEETDVLVTRVNNAQNLLGDTSCLRLGINRMQDTILPGELSSHASATTSTTFFACERVSASITSDVNIRSCMAPSVRESHTASEHMRASFLPLDDQRSCIILCVCKDQEEILGERMRANKTQTAIFEHFTKANAYAGNNCPLWMLPIETALDALKNSNISHLYFLLARKSLNASKNVCLGDPHSWCKLC